METIEGYWVCACGNFNSKSFSWCLECAQDFRNDYSRSSMKPENQKGYVNKDDK